MNPKGQIFTYEAYRAWMGNLVANGQSTGESTPDLVAYTKMNEQRMNRWDKTASLSEEFKKALQTIQTPQTWYILTEPWCGDASQNLVWLHLAQKENPNITLQLILRDENLDIMDEFLTNGGRAVPKVIFVKNEDQTVLSTWGPRPESLQDLVMEIKTQVTKEKLHEEIHSWYAKNKGQAIQAELLASIPILL